MKFVLTDIDYLDGIRLFGETPDGKRIIIRDENFKPYFYADKKPPKISIGEYEITRIVKEGKRYRIEVNKPSAIPVIRDSLREIRISEYDIPVTKRYLIDKGLVMLEGVEDFKKCKINWEPRILAVDIETTNKKGVVNSSVDEVLMISLWSNFGVKKVLLSKESNEKYAESYPNEKEMLLAFDKIITETKPGIIVTYNGDNFDWPFLRDRMNKYGIKRYYGFDGSPMTIIKKRTGSAARIKGVAHIDLYVFILKILSNQLKTSSLDLGSVSRELLNSTKKEMDWDEFYLNWDNNDLKKIVEYSITDAKVTYELFEKLKPIIFEIAKLANLPLYEATRASYSSLVENYLINRAKEFNETIPPRPSGSDIMARRMISFTGGYVHEPSPGIYEDIAVVDFRSLYPTIIVSYNIGPETINGKGIKVEVNGRVHEFRQDKKGFIPQVVKDLVEKRAAIKKMLKKEKNPLLEARSYAIKTITNAIYGYLSYPRSRWYCFDCAESITALGRKHIKQVISEALKNGFGVIYGDSLPYDRRIFIQEPSGDIKLIKIGELRGENLKTLSFKDDKLIFLPIVRAIKHRYKGHLLEITTTHGKTVVTPQHSVYSEQDNKIVLVDAKNLKVGDKLISLTNPRFKEKYKEGFVFDVLNSDFKEYNDKIRVYEDNLRFKAGERGICPYCKKEYLLYSHVSLKHQDRKLTIKEGLKTEYKWIGGEKSFTERVPRFWSLTEDLAWVLGFYCAEGSISEGKKNIISFGNQNIRYIKKVKSYFDKILKTNLKIIKNFDKRNKKFMYYYRIQRMPLVPIIKYFFNLGKGAENKRVPWFIYNSEAKIKKAFIKGYLDGKRYKTNFIQFTTKSKDLAIGVQLLLKSMNNKIEHIYWKYRTDKPKINQLRLQSAKKDNQRENYCLTEIKSIKEIKPTSEFVYDIEVKGAHNFVDAEGLILVHNTDSAFLTLKNKTKKELLAFLKDINDKLPGIMELELERFCKRGLFVRGKGEKGIKKRYALLDENDKLIIKGFEFVRGDWSQISKETQYKVFNALLRDNDREKAINIVRKTIDDLKKNKIPLKKLIITTQLTRNVNEYKSIGPHVAVAKRLISKGWDITAGTMISYIITQGKGLMREKARTPDEVIKENLTPDADYYIHHQIIPAVERVLDALNVNENDLEKKQRGLRDFL